MDRAEFNNAVIEQLDACYRMAIQLTRHPDQAADLVQEACLRAIRNFEAHPNHTFTEHGAGIRAWLFTIIHNLFFSQTRKTAVRSEIGWDADSTQAAASDTREGPDEPPPAWDLRTLDWEYTDERLKKAIDALTPAHREVLLLWGVEGMKYREIAAVTGVPIGTVMSRLHRARSILAESLEELRAETGWKSDPQGHVTP